MKKIIAILYLCILAGNACAGSLAARITRVNLASPQYANLQLEDATINTSGHPCANNTTHLSWDKTTEHGKQMLSVTLLALAADKRLFFIYSDSACGKQGQALITRVDIIKN